MREISAAPSDRAQTPSSCPSQIALARQLARAEAAAARARSEVLTLRQQLDEREARLFASERDARAAHAEQQRAIRRLESALACQARGLSAFAQVFI